MKEVLKFEGSFCSKYSNALHASFHNRIWMKVNAIEDKTKINIADELLQEYGDNIATEEDLCRESRVSDVTPRLAELDKQRDELVSYIINTVYHSVNVPITNIRTAGVALEAVCRPYRGIQQESYDAESKLIKGLLLDLSRSENTTHIMALNLSEAVSSLRTINQEFEDLQSQRTDTRAASHRNQMSQVRPQTDKIYQRICDLIYASQLVCTTPEDLPLIETLIQEINGIIKEFKLSYNQSMGQKKKGNDGGDRPVFPFRLIHKLSSTDL